MNYVQQATEALRTAVADQGKDPNESLSPDIQQLYTLLVLTTGEDTTLADVHDAWACARAITRPDHKDLVVFDQLDDGVADWDIPFRDAIVAAARSLAKEG